MSEANQGQTGSKWHTQVQGGMPILGADGDRVGVVKEVRENTFLVNRPRARDVYVPYQFIDSIAGGQILLRIPSDVIGNMGWENPPAGGPPPPLTGTFRETK